MLQTVLVAWTLWPLALALVAVLPPVQQLPLLLQTGNAGEITSTQGLAPQKQGRKLKGRFLHLTDIHPDALYKVYSSTEAGIACHRGDGPAGLYGAETSDCDSPQSLVNATFTWIEENLKDEIDFIIWTGDSARHDNDDHNPRSDDQVLTSNNMLVSKFKEVFKAKQSRSPNDVFEIPIIPTFGNNDILPHNIFMKGPNKWTKLYSQVWRDIIPEEQRHGFDRGGWFFVEVIPNHLAVFSLNTMYFFDSNSAVDGCSSKHEPGYEHMEWLRIQLEFLRERGMKAIMSGHVAPARNDQKVGWDETCWQKYTIWMQQYRDVVVGSVYGHMNVEHFVLQDFQDINLAVAAGVESGKRKVKRSEETGVGDTGGDVEIAVNVPDYLHGLRKIWSKLPNVPRSVLNDTQGTPGKTSKKEQKFYDKIGGQYAERFSMSYVAASVVPNYFPSLRVFHYNITGLENMTADARSASIPAPWIYAEDTAEDEIEEYLQSELLNLKRRSFWPMPQEKTKRKKPSFTMPKPPSKNAPPGPAYSPQTLSWLGYTQYYANLTYINNDFTASSNSSSSVTTTDSPPPSSQSQNDALSPDAVSKSTSHTDTLRWNEGKHSGKHPHKHRPTPHPLNFTYEIEYDTRTKHDDYGLKKGLLVKEWVELAARIGEFKTKWENVVSGEVDLSDDRVEAEEWDEEEDAEKGEEDDSAGGDSDDESGSESEGEVNETSKSKDKDGKKKKKMKKDKKQKKKHRKAIEKLWFAFTSRAVVGTMEKAELMERFS